MITHRSQDKYAFLLTGPTEARFIKDVENVFQMLTEYYNYPAGNIHVVIGSNATIPAVPGATLVISNTVAGLQNALTNFIGAASIPPVGMPPGSENTALLYFTGGGITDVTGSKLVIDDAGGTTTIEPTWLTTRLNTFSNCQVNVLMQQSFSGGFLAALSGSILTQWSFTSACNSTEESYGNDVLGSFFTHGWIRGLKCETLPPGTPDSGKYADELFGSTEVKISLEKAKEFGKQVHDAMGFGAFSTPAYTEVAGAKYLGLPALLIRDGAVQWWESPDIYLTYQTPYDYLPPGDLYIPDPLSATPPYNNNINVDTRNVGTHPVRRYSLGIELFKSGIGATNEKQTVCDIVPAGGLLLPIELSDIGTAADQKDTHIWNTPFWQGTTHECVKAEAKHLCVNVDFSWSVTSYDFEAQRNTDEMTIVPLRPSTAPPGPFSEFRGFKKHRYGFQNRFEEPRRFLLIFPNEYAKYKDKIQMTFFRAIEKPKSQELPIDVVEEPLQHIPFTLQAGENQEVIVQVELKEGFQVKDAVKFPFEIVTQGEWREARAITATQKMLPNFAPIGGFTVTIKNGKASLKGVVLDKENRPAVEARVFMRTVNDLQRGTLVTDAKGAFILKDINPDVYEIWAEHGTLRSEARIVVLLDGKTLDVELNTNKLGLVRGRRLKIILDKIRILDDHDPCIKGKGELVFHSVVIPDNDVSRKTVVKLPSTGFYKVGDKPGENEVRVETVLFDGVVKNRSLEISISGKELDTFDPDDNLNRYHRVFTGSPDTWAGQYYPTDEYLDKEHLGDWELWYRIVSNQDKSW